MNFNEKCLHFVAAVGMLEPVRCAEESEEPKGARAIALQNLIDSAVKVGNFYGGPNGLNGFADRKRPELIASLDRIEKIIQQAFNPKRVGRDDKGRFVKLGGV